MKKVLSGIIAVLMCTALFTGCKSADENTNELPSLDSVTSDTTTTEPLDEVKVTTTTTKKESETTTVETTSEEETTVETEETTTAESSETTTAATTTTAPATTTAAPAATTAAPAATTAATTITTAAPVVDVTTDGDPCVPTIVSIENRYAYSQLNDAEKQLYSDIVDAVRHLKGRVKTSVEDVTWHKVFGMVYNQEPQLFYLKPTSSKGKIKYITGDRTEIASKYAEIEAVANSVVATANTKSTTTEKLKVFHDYIVLNNGFELDDGHNSSIYGGLVAGNLQCGGYAKTMQYLCDKAGIYSMVVTGVGKHGSTHAWNVVYVNGAYYNLDTTWDDPILNPPVANNLRYRYFLVPDSWIHELSHFSVNQITLSTGEVIKYFNPPACTNTSANYYSAYGKLYSTQKEAETGLYNEIVKAANAGMRVAEVRVTSKEVYDAMKGNLRTYSTWAKEANTTYKVKKVSAATDDILWVIEIDLGY